TTQKSETRKRESKRMRQTKDKLIGFATRFQLNVIRFSMYTTAMNMTTWSADIETATRNTV
ncbi:hypothetical protein BCR33DRAFT_710986, partial [Rhizoclosmatium globosum]